MEDDLKIDFYKAYLDTLYLLKIGAPIEFLLHDKFVIGTLVEAEIKEFINCLGWEDENLFVTILYNEEFIERQYFQGFYQTCHQNLS